MGDPVGACAYVKDVLKPDGTCMVVEPFANLQVESMDLQGYSTFDRITKAFDAYQQSNSSLTIGLSASYFGPRLWIYRTPSTTSSV